MSTFRGSLMHKVISKIVPVIDNYVRFLERICNRIESESEENLDTNDRKYLRIKKELYDFIFEHQMYFEIVQCTLTSADKSFKESIAMNIHAPYEEFLKFDDFFTMKGKQNHHVLNSSKTHAFRFQYELSINWALEDEIKYKIKSKLEMRARATFSDEVIRRFFENNFLLKKDELKTTFTNYENLAAHIDKRMRDYKKFEVSVARIDDLSYEDSGKLSCEMCGNDSFKVC